MSNDGIQANACGAALVETWFENLDGQARLIVESESKRQCVQAGPGTGKSYCMTRRLLRLIQQKRVQPEQVLAVTFTRTAATDLRNTLEKTLGEPYLGFRASTLHSLCFNIVEEQRFLEVRSRYPRFLLNVTKAGCLNFEAAPMLSDLKQENDAYKGAREQSKRIKEYEAMWARRQQDPLGAPGDGIEAAYGTSLLTWLKFHRAMMVGELVKEAYEFMSQEPDTPWRRKFRAVLVDEYQDLNKLDQELVELLCADDETTVSIVGDIDQSIYSFRCAHPEGLQEYAQRGGVEASTMEESRRCPTSVLAIAQTLIKQNTKKAGQYPKPLAKTKAGQVFLRRWADRATEVQGVLKFVRFCMTQGVPIGEILVMVPSRVIGKEIKAAFRTAEIEAHSYFAEEQLEDEEAQKAFTLLTLLSNRSDRVALRCWLGSWATGHRAASYKKLRVYCETNNAEPFEVLEKVVAGELQLAGVNALLGSFNALRAKLLELKDLKGQALLDALFPPEADWVEDIRVLAGETVADDISARYLHELLVDSITQPTMPTEVNHVRIMSLHKAKGLTATASAIVGAIEGLIPRPHDPVKSILTEPEHLEEQRRLFYVALTRSTDFLLISSPNLVNSRFDFGVPIPGVQVGGGLRTAVSQFVTSLGSGTLPPASSSLDFP